MTHYRCFSITWTYLLNRSCIISTQMIIWLLRQGHCGTALKGRSARTSSRSARTGCESSAIQLGWEEGGTGERGSAYRACSTWWHYDFHDKVCNNLYLFIFNLMALESGEASRPHLSCGKYQPLLLQLFLC